MGENKKIILPNSRFSKADEEDLNLRVGLDSNESIIREGDRNIILDINELYIEERNESDLYKIHGKLRMVFNNSFLGTTAYLPLLEKLFKTSFNTGYLPYNEIALIRDDIFKEVNELSTTNNLDGFTLNIQTKGDNSHKNISPLDASKYNWNCYLTYVKDSNPDYSMKYTYNESGDTVTFTAKDGIPFKVIEDNESFILVSSVEHGISEGEYVIIDDVDYIVNSVGDETFRSERFIITLFKSQFENTNLLTDGEVVFGKRCLDPTNKEETMSQYYVHIHEVLTDIDDYVKDKIGFESSIWNDEKRVNDDTKEIMVKNRMETLYYDYKNNISITNLRNNFNISPTDIYVSIVNKNSNGYFNYPPKVGYEFHFHDTWIDEHFEDSFEPYLTSTTENINTIDFEVGNMLNIGDNILGNFIEYNPSELRERTISNLQHKLTIPTTLFDYGQENDMGSIDNPTGIIYQPHYKISLRQLSPYIESSETNDIVNLPDNTLYFENEGLWKWRDIYDHGFIDSDGLGTDFPFTNGIHYVKKDINFYIKDERLMTNKKDGLTDFNDIKIKC